MKGDFYIMKQCLKFLFGVVIWVLLTLPLSAAGLNWMSGCTIWPLGVNYAWKNWGSDFSSASNLTGIKSDLDAMYTKGVRVVRWWVFTDFQSSPTWSGTGRGSTCTGLPSGWVANMKAACDYAQTKGMKFYFCMSSFDMAKTAHAWHHDDVIDNATVRTSFINNAIIPIASALGTHQGIFGWDIVNEPEWMIQSSDNGGADTTCTQFSLANVRAYAQAMASAIHANASQPVSVGSASLKWCSKKGAGSYSYDFWSGIGLDFYDAHFYDWMTASGYDPIATTAASWKLDKPVMVGEAISDPSTYSGTLNPKNYLGMATALYNNGYSGLLAWAWTDTANNCVNTISPYFGNFLTAHSDVGSAVCSGGPTNTPVVTLTSTYSRTRTQTPTFTRTWTLSATRSATLSATQTFTATRTQTSSVTATPTFTWTLTFTLTPTKTFTPSFSGTSTLTATGIVTATSSVVATATAAASKTSTATSTLPQTATFTRTASYTPVNTETGTPVNTNTLTAISTGTPANTGTVTPAATSTGTALPTKTSTAVNTYTTTPTGSVVPTSTSTVLTVFTSTVVSTITSSAVPTITSTASKTPTATNTSTQTWTTVTSPTFTATRTSTKVPTQTFTVTMLPSATATATTTSADQPAIVSVLVYPNPVGLGEDLQFKVSVLGCPQDITLRIYTASFRRVFDKTWLAAPSVSKYTLDILAWYVSSLANGTYYYVLILKDCKGGKVMSKRGALLIIK